MVGNVWEWVEGAILDASMNGRAFPAAGYMGAVDAEGLPLTTSADAPNVSFGGDYFWIEEMGAMGIVRGGYWASGPKGGVYSIYAASPPTFVGDAVGFRCAL
jgi:formylglycine-generating enzyme required for sulfatase activity